MASEFYEPTLEYPSADGGTGGCAAGRYFKSAWIGLESSSAREAAESGSPPWDQTLDAVRERCAAVFGARFGKEQVTLFHNTTAGVHRVLSRLQHIIGQDSLTLLTTDLEYPGVIAALDENWQGRLVIAEVGHLIWEQQGSLVPLALQNAFMLAEPDVLYLSHVARATGYELPVGSLLSFARALNPRLVIVLDGAQAAGNILVDSQIVNEVDFYLTSGHKWLGGKPTLGVVLSAPEWMLSDPSQSYSRKFGSAGTGIAEALRSFLKALEEFVDPHGLEDPRKRQGRIAAHNTYLAGVFADRVRHQEEIPGTAPHRPTNGIVTIPDVPEGIVMSLVHSGFEVSWLSTEPWRTVEGGQAPGKQNRFLIRVDPRVDDVSIREARLRQTGVGPVFPPLGSMRACFHLYHGEDDVVALATAFLAARARSDAAI